MQYAFTFDTIAQYQAAKASGGAIYNSVYANSAGNLSRAAVSLIKQTGQSVIDAVNTIVPRSAGGIGDCLLYKGGEYFWLTSSVEQWDASSLGQQLGIASEITAAGYTRVGFCVSREGKRCLLISTSDLGGYVWSNNTTDFVPGMTKYGGMLFHNPESAGGTKSNWIGPFSLYISEKRYPPTNPEWGDWQYVLPFQRSVWNTVVDNLEKAMRGASFTASGTMTSGSWSVAWNSSTNRYEGKITFSQTAVGTRTVNVLDYGCNFDLWYKRAMIACYPTVDASNSAGGDMNGKRNTGCMLHFSGGSPAAEQAAAHAVTGVSDFGAGKWWLGSMGEWLKAMRNVEIWHKKGCSLNLDVAYWTSSQSSSATGAWCVRVCFAHAGNFTRTSGCQVRPFSAFQI